MSKCLNCWLTFTCVFAILTQKEAKDSGIIDREVKIMSQHAPGVDMVAQAEVVELKGKVRDYEKELKEYEKKSEKQEKEIERLKNITGKSYGIGTVWFVAIVSFLIGIGATAAFFLLT